MDETDFLTRLQGYGQALRNRAESITRLLGLIQLKPPLRVSPTEEAASQRERSISSAAWL